MDATVAYRQSCLRVIEYLRRYGYDDYQIYLMLSCIPIEGHVAGIVDVSAAILHFRARWLTQSRFRMLVRRLGCRWISLTLTSGQNQK